MELNNTLNRNGKRYGMFADSDGEWNQLLEFLLLLISERLKKILIFHEIMEFHKFDL